MFTRALDVGGSQTRIASTKDEVRVHDSVYMEIKLDMPVKAYIEDKRSDFIIMDSPRSGVMQKRYAKGVAMNYSMGKVCVTDNQSTKVEQDSTYVNAIYAVACELLASGVEMDTVRLGVCIPTAEFYSDQFDYVEVLKNGLKGDHEVYFPLLDKTVAFTIDEKGIVAFPEGVVAAFQFVRDRNFTAGNTLIVDAGYRSTDITILKNFKPLGRGSRSVPVGGINIEAILLGELERVGILANREEVRLALETGYIMKSNDPVPIHDQILSTLTKFASDLRNNIIDVLSSNMLTLRSINNVLFLGRPFIPSNGISLQDILLDQLGGNLTSFPVSDLALANVTEAIGAMKRGPSL